MRRWFRRLPGLRGIRHSAPRRAMAPAFLLASTLANAGASAATSPDSLSTSTGRSAVHSASRALPDLLVTDRTAAAFHLAVGDTVEASADAGMRGARLFRVAGIYRPKADPFEVGYGRLRVQMHLPDLAALLGAEDTADRFAVRLREPSARQRVTDDINRAAYGIRAYTSTDLAQRSSSTFVVIAQFHKAIGIVTLLAGLVFLAAIMVLKVEEMRRELGVLRLIGVSRRTVVRSVFAIAALVALLGSLAGVALGYLAVSLVNPLAQHRYDTDLVFARISPGVIAASVGLSIVMGVLAGLFVAARIARGHPLEQVGR